MISKTHKQDSCCNMLKDTMKAMQMSRCIGNHRLFPSPQSVHKSLEQGPDGLHALKSPARVKLFVNCQV